MCRSVKRVELSHEPSATAPLVTAGVWNQREESLFLMWSGSIGLNAVSDCERERGREISSLSHLLFSLDCTYDGITHYAGETFDAGDGCNTW